MVSFAHGLKGFENTAREFSRRRRDASQEGSRQILSSRHILRSLDENSKVTQSLCWLIYDILEQYDFINAGKKQYEIHLKSKGKIERKLPE